MEAAVQLLASIIALLTPLPYFRPILMTIADKVLDAGEMYSNSVSPVGYTRRNDFSNNVWNCFPSSVDLSSPRNEITPSWEWH